MRGVFGNHRRRALAMFAGVLWLLGVVVLPALHEGHHTRNHTHDAAGTILVSHGDHDHRIAAKPRHSSPGGYLAIDHPIEPGHQAGGIAHHAVALHQAVPPELPVAPIVVERTTFTTSADQISASAVPSSARGPPARA